MAHQARGFRSPLRDFGVDVCDMVGSEDAYGDAQARVAQWRKDLVSSAGFDAQQGLRDLCYERAHLKDLQADLSGVQGLVETASQLQAGGARLVEVLHSSSNAAGSRSQAVVAVKEELNALVNSHHEQIQKEDLNIAQQQDVADAQHEEALKLLATYKERLGLSITRVAPQTVRMAFSLLDECEPEREFVFTLGLGDVEAEKSSDGYHVCECVPHVSDLQALVTELNANASSATALPRFVCSMRRAFLKLSSGTKAL